MEFGRQQSLETLRSTFKTELEKMDCVKDDEVYAVLFNPQTSASLLEHLKSNYGLTLSISKTFIYVRAEMDTNKLHVYISVGTPSNPALHWSRLESQAIRLVWNNPELQQNEKQGHSLDCGAQTMQKRIVQK